MLRNIYFRQSGNHQPEDFFKFSNKTQAKHKKGRVSKWKDDSYIFMQNTKRCFRGNVILFENIPKEMTS